MPSFDRTMKEKKIIWKIPEEKKSSIISDIG